ncbi:MAG: hypothetical protein RL204_809 [Bacteroidota bacterium]|jgi:hypothetical protein
MDNTEDILAFIKYEGKLVEDGYLDARKSGEALVGIDELIRYFVYQENPQIKDFEFEIPVRVRRGSWETVFPENIDKVALGAFGLWMAGKYVGSALEEVAKNDFKDVSFKAIFKKAFTGIINVIKLSKHLGTLTRKKFDNVVFGKNNELVKITNDKGEELWIPVEVLELYSNCPQTVFNKLTKIIEEDRELVVGIYDDNIIVEETITTKHKYIFSKTEEDEEVVLPELKHGDYIELQGHITRGNEKSNTIGFLYQGHIITSYPDFGNIKQHKSKLFSNCLLKGYVDRLDKDANINEKRPRIRFIDIVSLEKPNADLFDQ